MPLSIRVMHMSDHPSIDLPNIPGKRYFSTSEVANICQIKTHVLRYWEKEFPSLQPTRKNGGQRYYQYNDVILVCFIQHLVHVQGYSLNYARRYLRQYGKANIVQSVVDQQSQTQHSLNTPSQSQQASIPSDAEQMLKSIKQELQAILEHLK